MGVKTGEVSPRVQALLAAVLFGAGTPLSKILLGTIDPLVLAGLLYGGAGLAATLVLAWLLRRGRVGSLRFTLREGLALAGSVLAGGVMAPVLMMHGLHRSAAGTASLLLNVEAVATSLLAALVFHEAVGRRIWIAVALVTAGAIVLAWQPGQPHAISIGLLAVVGACFLWGVDNNLTRLVSSKDPMAIVAVKGWVAGAVSLGLARAIDVDFPPLPISTGALAVGSVSFGFSIALFIRALRALGAARTGALFGTAPFMGALLSWMLLNERPDWGALAALPLMGAGAFLLLTESHRHVHHHPELVHEHSHRHDDAHHDHVHQPDQERTTEAHTHLHRHPPMTHNHTHAPDLHHRHRHNEE